MSASRLVVYLFYDFSEHHLGDAEALSMVEYAIDDRALIKCHSVVFSLACGDSVSNIDKVLIIFIRVRYLII